MLYYPVKVIEDVAIENEPGVYSVFILSLSEKYVVATCCDNIADIPKYVTEIIELIRDEEGGEYPRPNVVDEKGVLYVAVQDKN